LRAFAAVVSGVFVLALIVGSVGIGVPLAFAVAAEAAGTARQALAAPAISVRGTAAPRLVTLLPNVVVMHQPLEIWIRIAVLRIPFVARWCEDTDRTRVAQAPRVPDDVQSGSAVFEGFEVRIGIDVLNLPVR